MQTPFLRGFHAVDTQKAKSICSRSKAPTLSIVKQLCVNKNKSVLTNQKKTPSYGVYSTEREVVSEWTLNCFQ